MFQKIFAVVAVTGMFAMAGSNAMAQTGYPQAVLPTQTYVQPTAPGVVQPGAFVSPPVYGPGANVYLNPQPLPPGIVVQPGFGVYGGYPYGYYGRGYYGGYYGRGFNGGYYGHGYYGGGYRVRR